MKEEYVCFVLEICIAEYDDNGYNKGKLNETNLQNAISN